MQGVQGKEEKYIYLPGNKTSDISKNKNPAQLGDIFSSSVPKQKLGAPGTAATEFRNQLQLP